jgi:hypothetical protein
MGPSQEIYEMRNIPNGPWYLCHGQACTDGWV